jgi:hypothetical protein
METYQGNMMRNTDGQDKAGRALFSQLGLLEVPRIKDLFSKALTVLREHLFGDMENMENPEEARIHGNRLDEVNAKWKSVPHTR